MNDDADDETFRLEFLNRMSAILGFTPPAAPEMSAGAPTLAERGAEVVRLRALMDKYQAFAKEISNGKMPGDSS